MNKILTWTKNRVKGLDLYPSTVTLTYKGSDSFQTLYGGIISLFILLAVFTFSLRLFIIMFSRGETSKSRNTSIHDIHTKPEDYDIDLNSFGFSFVFIDLFTNQKFYDETYFKISVSQTSLEYNASSGAFNLTAEPRDFSI